LDEHDKAIYEMILRDFFAGMALLGMYAAGSDYHGQSRVERAELAYNSADAMMKARDKATT
jgi:hypothetical protein